MKPAGAGGKPFVALSAAWLLGACSPGATQSETPVASDTADEGNAAPCVPGGVPPARIIEDDGTPFIGLQLTVAAAPVGCPRVFADTYTYPFVHRIDSLPEVDRDLSLASSATWGGWESEASFDGTPELSSSGESAVFSGSRDGGEHSLFVYDAAVLGDTLDVEHATSTIALDRSEGTISAESLSVGDLDSDGVDDAFFAGTFVDAATGNNAARGWVTFDVLRPEGGVIGATDRLVDVSPDYSESWGFQSVIDDFGGDGMDDLVIANTGQNTHLGALSQEVYAYEGPVKVLPVANPDVTLAPSTVDELSTFGTFLAGGDLDGDGYLDLAVADPNWRPDGVNWRGGVFVFPGPLASSGLDGAALTVQGEPSEDAGYLWHVTFDRTPAEDGSHALVVSAPESGAGVLYAVPGNITGVASVGPEYALAGGTSDGDYVGWNVAALGDVDGDGLGDFAAASGSPGIPALWFFYSSGW